ncbi:MAG TPA: hypothetical protein VLB84_04540, partial [Bacteroidia bacterium]|nr:hypothetical protein [Bacteroidia bacterium]
MNKNLRGLLKHIVNFDEQQLDRITGCFKSKIVKRNELILATGNTCKEFYFVHKGCIRTGFHTKEGREKTRYVMYDCSIGTALLRPLDVPVRWYVILVPPVEVPTREIFAAPELTRDTEALKMEDFSAHAPSGRFRNDLEAVVTARYPVVGEYLEWLRRHGEARMTGSGGCVFAGFDAREAAQQVLDRLPAPMKGFVAQGLE